MSTLQNETEDVKAEQPTFGPKPEAEPRPKQRRTFGDFVQRLSAGPWVFHRPRRRKIPRPTHCLNCGDSLTGNFCANCGQEAVDERAAIWPLVSDVLSEFARWDSKFVRTLLPLLFRPGYLTNEYNLGKRASYLAPFRLFLSVSVLFFLLLSWRGDSLINVQSAQFSTHSHSAGSGSLTLTPQQQAKTKARIDDSSHGLQQTKSRGPLFDQSDVDDLNESIHDAGTSLPPTAQAKLKGLNVSINPMSEQQASSSPVNVSGQDWTTLLAGWNKLPKLGAATQQELDWASSPSDWKKVPLLYPQGSIDGTLSHLPTTVQLYDALQANRSYPYKSTRFWQRVIERLYKYGVNPGEFSNSLYALAPKVAIGLIPIFALLMYPLYLRAHRFYVEHLVFALHNHTFLFIAMAISILTRGVLSVVLFGVMVVYMFAAMQVVYKQHWFKTLLKFSLVGATYLGLLAAAVVLTIAATLFYG